jgi:glycosyltransferase involved in cell wall biosynthesis
MNIFTHINPPSFLLISKYQWYWQTYKAFELPKKHYPAFIKDINLKKYKQTEELAWGCFNYIIAINKSEYNYIKEKVKPDIKVMFMPMGIPLDMWKYSYSATLPVRIGFYGGLNSTPNQKGALLCAKNIMPMIWTHYPNAELWLIGAKPPAIIKELELDTRIKVTGYVKDIATVLSSVKVMLCPWDDNATYGFRSRIIEVLALGVPIVASPSAIDGMELEVGKGIMLATSINEMIEKTMDLLSNESLLIEQSLLANRMVIEKFSYEATYLQGFHNISTQLIISE